MRVTLCEACQSTDPTEFPMGWVFLNIVIGTTADTGGLLGPRTTTDYERHSFCSVACLTAYVALEGVHGEAV